VFKVWATNIPGFSAIERLSNIVITFAVASKVENLVPNVCRASLILLVNVSCKSLPLSGFASILMAVGVCWVMSLDKA